MIIYCLLTHVKDSKLQLNPKMIKSINNQSNKDFRVVMAINNFNGEEFEVEDILNLDKVLLLKTNNVGLARNSLIDYCLSNFNDSDYIFSLDGDDELLIDATKILQNAIQSLDDVYAVNFYHRSRSKIYPEVADIDIGTNLGFKSRFNWYLMNLGWVRNNKIYYYDLELSCDDAFLACVISMKLSEVTLIKDPIQYYNIDIDELQFFDHNSSIKPKNADILGYLFSFVNLKIKNIV